MNSGIPRSMFAADPGLPSFVLLLGLFFYATVEPSAAPSPPTIDCKGGGLLYQSPAGQKHCVDPGLYARAADLASLGVQCSAPAVGEGATVYAELRPGQARCLKITAIPEPGKVVQFFNAWWLETNLAGVPSEHRFSSVTQLVPGPGSNLCPDPTGTSLQVCAPGQVPP